MCEKQFLHVAFDCLGWEPEEEGARRRGRVHVCADRHPPEQLQLADGVTN